jgi:hypothetical protein
VWRRYKQGEGAKAAALPTLGWLIAPARLTSQIAWCRGELASFAGGDVVWTPAMLEWLRRVTAARDAIEFRGEDSLEVRARVFPAEVEARLQRKVLSEAQAVVRDMEARLMAGDWIW